MVLEEMYFHLQCSIDYQLFLLYLKINDIESIASFHMDNKLQELTDKLYREGLSRGKEEGEALLAKAEEKASGIIDTAQKKVKEIILNAEKEAAAFRT